MKLIEDRFINRTGRHGLVAAAALFAIILPVRAETVAPEEAKTIESPVQTEQQN